MHAASLQNGPIYYRNKIHTFSASVLLRDLSKLIKTNKYAFKRRQQASNSHTKASDAPESGKYIHYFHFCNVIPKLLKFEGYLGQGAVAAVSVVKQIGDIGFISSGAACCYISSLAEVHSLPFCRSQRDLKEHSVRVLFAVSVDVDVVGGIGSLVIVAKEHLDLH